LGIDPGLARVGYGLVRTHGQSLDLLDYGLIETPARQPRPDRLRRIHEGLLAVIDANRPSDLVIEALFFAKNVTTGIAVGEARGVVLLAAAERSLRVHEVSPTSVKSSLTGNGRADKYQMQRMIQVLFRLAKPPRPDDVADAIALAVHGSHPAVV